LYLYLYLYLFYYFWPPWHVRLRTTSTTQRAGTIDVFEFTTLILNAQAGKTMNLGLQLQHNHALSTSDALVKANEDWAKRAGKATVAVAPAFATDANAQRRAAKAAAALDPASVLAAGDGPAGLLSLLRLHEVADQDCLLRLRRLNVSAAHHLSLLSVAAMLDAGFNRVQARKLEAIGLQAKEAERRRASVFTGGDPFERFEHVPGGRI
jgi:hypothetical protein